jgi:hypothetical protein
VRKIVRWVLISTGVLFVGMQLFRPDMTNPPVDAEMAADRFLAIDPEVGALLRTACYDCHSNETRWPWYSHVAPASWLLARDVKEGRGHLNFSTWGKYAEGRRMLALEGIAEEVGKGGMPFPPYLALHPEARLDSAARGKIVDWAHREGDRLAGAE